MSDSSQGPGWWLASDGKWYPPQPVEAFGPPQPGWWKATDGIRETTWPGVYNRSRLPGRWDYFTLLDWDCYTLSGRSVTFTLPGFKTVKRDGIELTGTFVATVNAELAVGALHRHFADLGKRLGPDHVDVLPFRAGLHRGRGNNDRVGLLVEPHADVHELTRPERRFGVVELRAQPGLAQRLVPLAGCRKNDGD